ncbi:MAG: response regulator [Polyangia bacterium]
MKPRVLVVDDSMTVRMDLRGALTAAGFTVTTCETLGAAQAALRVQPFDLAILDVVLPDGSGIDLLTAIKQTPELRTIRVIMLSSQGEVRSRLAGLRLGAELYLGKPYDREFLVREARNLFKMSGPSGQPISRRSLTHQKLLVIDDHPTFLVALAAVLRQEGHQVVVAPSGEDALALAAFERFDGVLVDRIMPGLDGIETCRRLRALAWAEHVPIALMTGSITPAVEAEALAAGADEVLLKPTQLVQLSERWHALVRRNQQAQELKLPPGVAPAPERSRGSPLFHWLVGASGLSDLMAKTVLNRALERVGATPENVERDHIQRALPHLRGLLRTFLPGDEVSRRIDAIAALAGAPERPETGGTSSSSGTK